MVVSINCNTENIRVTQALNVNVCSTGLGEMTDTKTTNDSTTAETASLFKRPHPGPSVFCKAVQDHVERNPDAKVTISSAPRASASLKSMIDEFTRTLPNTDKVEEPKDTSLTDKGESNYISDLFNSTPEQGVSKLLFKKATF